jgi:Bacterial transcriptional activator domain
MTEHGTGACKVFEVSTTSSRSSCEIRSTTSSSGSRVAVRSMARPAARVVTTNSSTVSSSRGDTGERDERDLPALGASGGGELYGQSGLPAAAALEALDAEREDPAAVLGMSQGGFLDGIELPNAELFTAWATAHGARVRSMMLALLDSVVDRAASSGATGTGVAAARRILELDPVNEQAHYTLMRLFVAAGQPSSAATSTQNGSSSHTASRSACTCGTRRRSLDSVKRRLARAADSDRSVHNNPAGRDRLVGAPTTARCATNACPWRARRPVHGRPARAVGAGHITGLATAPVGRPDVTIARLPATEAAGPLRAAAPTCSSLPVRRRRAMLPVEAAHARRLSDVAGRCRCHVTRRDPGIPLNEPGDRCSAQVTQLSSSVGLPSARDGHVGMS